MFRLANKFEECILNESMNDSNGQTEQIKEKQEVESEK